MTVRYFILCLLFPFLVHSTEMTLNEENFYQEQDILVEQPYLWIKLTELEQTLFEKIVTNESKDPQLPEFNTYYEQELNDFFAEFSFLLDNYLCSLPHSDKTYNRLNQAYRQLQIAIKKEINRSIEMVEAFRESEGEMSYATSLAQRRWDKAAEQVFYKLMAIHPTFNREKLVSLLQARMKELYYYLQLLVKNQAKPSQKNEQLLQMHAEQLYVYSNDLNHLMIKQFETKP